MLNEEREEQRHGGTFVDVLPGQVWQMTFHKHPITIVEVKGHDLHWMRQDGSVERVRLVIAGKLRASHANGSPDAVLIC